MAKDILKEAIADAKAVREVALQNAKAALEEAFTPKLQNMLNSKLEEDLDEMYYDEDDNMDEDDMDEGMGMYDEDEKDMDEGHGMYDEDDSMDEEIDLEEILNELELEEGKDSDDDEVVDEAKKADDDEEDLDEAVGYPNYRADQIQKVHHNAEDINQGLNENAEFDLDELLKEINNLETKKLSETSIAKKGKARRGMRVVKKTTSRPVSRISENRSKTSGCKETTRNLESELKNTKIALSTVKSELNEVNLLNSKLLYVNRIFKANHLDDSQKLRVVETLDKAESTKEAKLIYETIKDTFNVANAKKVSSKNKTRSLQENFKGIASKSTGQSTAPKKAIISESNDMINRFQKLANIKINQ